MDNKEKKSNVNLKLIFLAAVFGFGAGFVGFLLAKSAVLSEFIGVPVYDDININRELLRHDSLVIENAKKIVVEQNDKVEETFDSAQKVLVGIFKKDKNTKGTALQEMSPEKHYQLNKEDAQGAIITNDGWIIANNFLENYSLNYPVGNFVIITAEKTIYEIDKVIKIEDSDYIFVHAKDAKNFLVKPLAGSDEVKKGQLALAIDWDGRRYLTSVIEKNSPSGKIFKSDEPEKNFLTIDDLEKYFNLAFIFNLNGEFIGFFEKKAGVLAADYFTPFINRSLIKKKDDRPSLGISYVSLEDFSFPLKYGRGALIYASDKEKAVQIGSAAEKAGLLKGDIIKAINNEEVNRYNNLSSIIQKYSAGETINVIYLRNGEEKVAYAQLKRYEK